MAGRSTESLASMSDAHPSLISEPFVAVRPNGQRLSFQVVISQPFPFSDKNQRWWRCDVVLSPLYEMETPFICGPTAFHALGSAIAHAVGALSTFVAGGG